MDQTYWARLLAAEYTGRKFLIVSESLAGATNLVRFLSECGAQRPFIVAATAGMGELPDPADAEWALLATTGSTHMDYIRSFSEAVTDLPSGIAAQIDAWDSERIAEVLDGFLAAESLVAARAHYGTRPQAWVDLEDKMVIDQIWDLADVRRAPSAVVPVAGSQIGQALGDLDVGAGTVWVADNTDGWHGGAEYLRWVRSADDAASARHWLATRCERMRIMPFLEGIPCSVHGFVFPDYVAAIRPIEMLVLRKARSTELKYAGTASFWDPPQARRGDARHRPPGRQGVASRIRLRRWLHRGRCDDPLRLSADRTQSGMGAGIGRAARGLPDLALAAINRALIAGVDIDYRPRDFEKILLQGRIRPVPGSGF